MGEQAGASLPWVENRPTTGWWPRLDLSDLWRYRELAAVLAMRDLKVRYKQTVIGVSWAVLQPLVAAAIVSLILGHLARLPAEGLPYPVFVFIGVSAWTYLSLSISTASLSLVGHREMVTRIYFPRLLPPLSALGPGLVDLGISLLVAAAMMAVYGVAPGIAILTLPLWLIALIFVAAGPALWFAALNIQYRDADHALKLILQVWLWASPIVYAQSLVPGKWIYLYGANPVVGVVEGLRWSLAGAPAPGGEALVSLATALLLAASGLVYFRHAERHFSDVI